MAKVRRVNVEGSAFQYNQRKSSVYSKERCSIIKGERQYIRSLSGCYHNKRVQIALHPSVCTHAVVDCISNAFSNRFLVSLATNGDAGRAAGTATLFFLLLLRVSGAATSRTGRGC